MNKHLFKPNSNAIIFVCFFFKIIQNLKKMEWIQGLHVCQEEKCGPKPTTLPLPVVSIIRGSGLGLNELICVCVCVCVCVYCVRVCACVHARASGFSTWAWSIVSFKLKCFYLKMKTTLIL